MPNENLELEQLLEADGPIAIIRKQYLRPAEGEGEPIFPPTYPMPTDTKRVHTVTDGKYRVSIELPAFGRGESKNGQKEDKESESRKSPGYNIDEFGDGSNVCEIDSAQSQANRLEPIFQKILKGSLVPQITFKVGQNEFVNLLSAGHRAADAVVRLSSQVNRFHDAFVEVKKGNYSDLARLAPTSILFGVWDSRGTQVKLPRIIKSEIRATNVRTLTRSAQYVPAADYVGIEAVSESLNSGDGEKNSLAAEGLKHIPAPRAPGGVIVKGHICQTFRINLVALRESRVLKGGVVDEEETRKLQRYLLGLALVAATWPPEPNLREGCLLCMVGKATLRGLKVDGTEFDLSVKDDVAQQFAEAAARAFYGECFDTKDIPDAIFESGVANEFLAMKKGDRDKISRSGPITAEAMRIFREKNANPFGDVSQSLKAAKKRLPTEARGKQNAAYVNAALFDEAREKLKEIQNDDLHQQVTRDCAASLLTLIETDQDSKKTIGDLEKRMKKFSEQQKGAAEPAEAQIDAVEE
jgi:CRISPR-associated protein Csb1